MNQEKLLAMMQSKKAAMVKYDNGLTPKPGPNRYVILPGWRKGEEETITHEYGEHFIKDAGGQRLATYVCQYHTYGKSCDVCAGIMKAEKETSDPAIVKMLNDSKASLYFLVNVLALDTSEPNKPQILKLRKTAFGALLNLFEDWGAAMFDPNEPQIIVVTREGNGLDTKYTVAPSAKKHVMPKGVLEKVSNLDEYVARANEENMRKALGAVAQVAGALPPPSDVPETPDSDAAPATASRTTEARNAAAVAAKPELGVDLDSLLGELDAAA